MNYIEVKIEILPFSEERSEIVLAEIDQLGFESYRTEEPFLTGYIPQDIFLERNLKTLLSGFHNEEFSVRYTLDFIREENWNAVWESDFEPITVAGLCTIKAPYHHGLSKTRYTINIDPKMAFGSGHHQTTCLMVEGMLEMGTHRAAAKRTGGGGREAGTDDANVCGAASVSGAAIQCVKKIAGSRVLDMGCGTGVLSILAAKMGAALPVHAIDIDPIAVRSANDNARRNRVPHKIKTLYGDASLIQAGQYDIVLANITRNILLQDLSTYARALRPDGVLMLSGFFEKEIPMLLAEAQNCGLTFVGQKVRDEWAMLKLQRG